MTAKVAELLRQAVAGKSPDNFVLTRANGKPVKDFRKAWQNLCVRAALGAFVCSDCARTMTGGVPESVIMATGGWKNRKHVSPMRSSVP